MTEQEMLREAARLLREDALESVREYEEGIRAGTIQPHEFSPEFEEKLFAGVNKIFAEKARRRRRKAILTRVASAALILVVGAGAAVGLSPTARANLFGWDVNQVEGCQDYTSQGAAVSSTRAADYTLAVPEGYRLEDYFGVTGSVDQLYVDGQGGHISLSYLYETENTTGMLSISADESEREEVQVQGHAAHLYDSGDPERSSTLVWTDPKTEALVTLSADLPREDLLALAETVTTLEKRDPTGDADLPHYQLTLPGGYWLSHQLRLDEMICQTYRNDAGWEVEAKYYHDPVSPGQKPACAHDGTTEKTVDVGGLEARLYLDEPGQGGLSAIVWTDPKTNTRIEITANLEEDALLALARSATLAED